MVARIHQDDLFSLQIRHLPRSTQMTMEVLGPVVRTDKLPHTSDFLKKHLPSILRSKCFNKNKYPFSKEVKATELGHLFEHILLEYLSNGKRLRSLPNVIHNGLTTWDWNKEKTGVFHIKIDASYEDQELFYVSLEKTIYLMRSLLRKRVN